MEDRLLAEALLAYAVTYVGELYEDHVGQGGLARRPVLFTGRAGCAASPHSPPRPTHEWDVSAT